MKNGSAIKIMTRYFPNQLLTSASIKLTFTVESDTCSASEGDLENAAGTAYAPNDREMVGTARKALLNSMLLLSKQRKQKARRQEAFALGYVFVHA